MGHFEAVRGLMRQMQPSDFRPGLEHCWAPLSIDSHLQQTVKDKTRYKQYCASTQRVILLQDSQGGARGTPYESLRMLKATPRNTV